MTEEKKPRTTRRRVPSITAERLQLLRAMPYQEYLKTPEWKEKRQTVYRFAGGRCQVCYSKGSKDCPLAVHHRTYERLGQERLSDMILLCEKCHTLFHRNRRLAS